MQSGSRNPSNHAICMVIRRPNNGLQDLGDILNGISRNQQTKSFWSDHVEQ
jgi:hypothetical protein